MMTTSHTFARRLYTVAAIYGILVLAPQYFMEARIAVTSPPAITHPEFFYGFVGLALVWQFAFLLIARDPRRYQPLMPITILEKLSFGLAAVVLFALQRLSPEMLVAGSIDLLLGALFLVAWRRTPAMAVAALALVLTACGGKEPPAVEPPTGPIASHPAWVKDANIYEVNVRQFTPEGTFNALMPHLPRLQRLGVDILWLMPVQAIGVKERKGSLGSYYSIADYRKMNPAFGTQAELKAVIDSAHRLGMHVVLDWVANHTSHDHTWIAEHPDWYTHRADGSISNAIDNDGKETDWTDVADLNYENAEMRAAMIEDMKWWVTEMGLDGFRCDVAWGVPIGFWREARTALLAAKPDLFLLAEAEGPELHSAFDASYGWEFHHLLNAIAQGKEPVTKLDEYLAGQSKYPANAMRMYFTSNHDENSWQGTEFERMGLNHQAAFVLSATMPNSFPLLYTGQEAKLSKRLRFFEKDTVTWTDTTLVPFYRSIFAMKHRTPALWNGSDGGAMARLAGDGGAHIYAFTRSKEISSALVAVNFGDAAETFTYQDLAMPGSYRDAFNGTPVELGATGTLRIPAHGYLVYVR